jgi:opacity protein-like surface antigen
MRLKIFIIIIGFHVLTSNLTAQSQYQESSLWLSFSGAMNFCIPSVYHFSDGSTTTKVHPGISGAAGVLYGPLTFVGPTCYSISIELVINNNTTDNPSNANKHTQMKFQQIAAMTWMKLHIPSKVSPFIRFGIGISNINYKENYVLNSNNNLDLFYNSVTFGAGGGVDISLTDNIILSIIGHGYAFSREIPVYYNNGNYRGTLTGGGVLISGLQINIKI